jgi:hypothetical protein
MSKNKDKFVLAIYPNALGFGFTFMENAITIKDYQIVTARPKSNASLMKRIIDYIEYYEPDVVVLEDYNGKQSRKSKRIKELIETVKKFTDSKGIKTTMYAREHIKFVFNGFKAKTKFEISRAITENIPELKKLMKPKRKIWEAESYSQGIFDAVSLGITYYFLTE